SSGLNAAILRTVGEDPLITEICIRSSALLRRPPESFSTTSLVDPCGLLLVANSERAQELHDWVRAAGSHVQAEPITIDRFRQLAPHFAGEIASAFYFPHEGRLDIAALCQGFSRFPPGAVEVRTTTSVRELARQRNRIVGVRLDDGEQILASTTVLAAGGWAGQLGAAVGSRVRLRPTRRHLAVTAPDTRVNASWPVVWSLGDAFYCRPESRGMLLCACDEESVDPDDCRPSMAVCEAIAEKTTQLLPDYADAQVAHLWCGMRTLSEDGRFVVGFDPDLSGLFWVAGLGGHGMVCAFEIGRLAADVLTNTVTDERLAKAFDPARL
ncbi:MAG: NAD(P)/FAD-dependent oxidoreductase, partial [Woeseiaceae bacterium]